MCEYCIEIREHHPMCPNYTPPKAKLYCSICKEGIYNEEEYIENDNNDYAHLDCVSYPRDLAEFLGYEIRKMRNDY